MRATWGRGFRVGKNCSDSDVQLLPPSFFSCRYHYYKANAPASAQPALALNFSIAGTGHGLAMMPYLRDTRRSAAGLGGFRLFYPQLNAVDPGTGKPIPNATHGYRFNDTVSLGAWYSGGEMMCNDGGGMQVLVAVASLLPDLTRYARPTPYCCRSHPSGTYFYADVHAMANETCPYASYLPLGTSAPVKPYYIPFRALTVGASPNTLVAGKSLSQSFWANAATRLHPVEWSTGTAAGVAAAVMAANGWTSAELYASHLSELEGALRDAGAPLEWTHT